MRRVIFHMLLLFLLPAATPLAGCDIQDLPAPPTYPGPLPGDIGPHGIPLDIHLLPLSRDAMQQAMRGRTTFVVAHRLSTLRHADRVIVLERGRIIQEPQTRFNA